MRALVLDSDGISLQVDRPVPTRGDGDVLVRVVRAGICDTDLQLVDGYMDFTGVLGHEFVGIADDGSLAGRRVVGEINCSCRRCPTCLAGRPTHCPHRTTIGIAGHDGAFADYIVVPQHTLHVVPDTMPTDVAVFAEPVAAACQIPLQVPLNRGDRVVVLGDGRLGNLCAQVLAWACDSVLVVGKHPEKLARLGALGIHTTLLADLPTDRLADVVVDCTGSDTGLPTALALVRPRGTIVLKTTVAGTQRLPWASIVIDEVTIVGSRCGPFDRALTALENGSITVTPLVSARFDLSDGVLAMDAARQPDTLKVLIDVAPDA